MRIMSDTHPQTHPFYAARAGEIAEAFERNVSLVRPEVERIIGRQIAPLMDEIISELHDVLAGLPYVGGDSGRMTPYFESNVGVIAMGRVLLRHGIDTDAVAHALKTVFLGNLSQMPEDDRRQLGRTFLSEESKAALRILARQSREAGHPGDFVYRFVEAGIDADGEPFDFGLDYSECGFCKLCAKTGDLDVLPMICAMDEESYGLRGVKLTRTRTLAAGQGKCNFRYSALPDATDEPT